MSPTPIYGCSGCATSGGAMSCPQHGGFASVSTGPVHVHDFQLGTVTTEPVYGSTMLPPKVVLTVCRLCGEVRRSPYPYPAEIL